MRRIILLLLSTVFLKYILGFSICCCAFASIEEGLPLTPVSYDEAVSEIWPKVNEPVNHEFNKPEPIERLPDEPKEELPKEEPAPAPSAPADEKEQPAPKKKIPGRFAVYTEQGYYVSKNKCAPTIKQAHIFKDYQSAHGIAKRKGGRVVKL